MRKGQKAKAKKRREGRIPPRSRAGRAGAELLDKIERKKARVAVLGLGYVGLPLAVEFAKAGFTVSGIDVDGGKIARLRRGVSYIQDVPSPELKSVVNAGAFAPTGDYSVLSSSDAIIICVPTPLRKTKDPDLSYVIGAVAEIGRRMRGRQLIVLESTTYPGTCEELILPFLQKGGGKVGKNFFLAFSPERVDPGNPRFATGNITKIIGGITPACTRLAAALYSPAIGEVYPVSSTRVAEMAKLLENTFRSVNIAMVNEMAMICNRMGIDVWEVIAAAKTKPFGFMPFYPGPGLGGHCLPIDPLYLSWKARVHDFEARLIEVAAQINARMPEYVYDLVSRSLNARGKCVRGAGILLCGVAYKRNVGDTRESPALDIMRLLLKNGARVDYSDPCVPSLDTGGIRLQSRKILPSILRAADCALIVTDHDLFDYEMIVKNSSLVIDTRHATRGVDDRLKKGRVVTL